MRDVARLAGVSVSTVSRIVNGTAHVEEATKKRVQEAIEEISFQPKVIAQGLRSKKTQLIGLVVPESLSESFGDFVRSTAQAVESRGYEPIIRYVAGDPDVEAEVVLKRFRCQIDGMILVPVSDQSRIAEIAGRFHKPVISMMREIVPEEIPSVVLNNYRIGELAAGLLLRFDHRRIVCITGNQDVTVVPHRL